LKISFSEEAREAFAELPDAVILRASGSIELLPTHPRMYPVRRIGIMKGYRYFMAYRTLFYYSVTSDEIRITGIIPGYMNLA